MKMTIFMKGMSLILVPFLLHLLFLSMLLEALQAQRQAASWNESAPPGGHLENSWVLLGGSAGSLLVTMCLALAYTRGIRRRLGVLTDNARRLARGEALAPPLDGNDELGLVDTAFRGMAQELLRTQEALRGQAAIQQTILDGIGDAVIVADTRGRFLVYNPAAVRMFGPPSHTGAGDRPRRLYLPDHKTLFPAQQLPLLRTLRGEAVDDVEMFVQAPETNDGRWTRVSGRPLADATGQPLGGVIVCRDISERKRAEEEIRQLNADLERRVQERTQELFDVNRELAQKNQENETFVYSVSHDLRSPLVNLEGFSRELASVCRELRPFLEQLPAPACQRGLDLLDRDMAESLHFISTAVRRLSGIIDALLRLSRAGRIEYQPRLVDMGPLMRHVADALHGTVVGRGATITIDELPPSWSDPTAIEIVFANLLGNAVNYLDPRRPGRIEVGALPDTDDVPSTAGLNGYAKDHGSGDQRAWRVYFVKDNGMGIPRAYLPKLFQAFQRLHPEAAPGEGMGLALIRRIVERHQGKIWVESEPGVGSTFFVALPGRPRAQCEGKGTAHAG